MVTSTTLLAAIQDSFHPHGFCYLWKPSLVWLHAGSDSLIAAAYYAIPFGIVYFVRRRRDVPFNWIFLAFATFIVACGTTHLMAVWTLWRPDYWASGMVKMATAGASLATAIAIIPLIPKAMRLPSPEQLENANQQLLSEIAERERVEAEVRRLNTELNQRVAELESKNQDLETFSHSISHDLRAPLRAVRGFTDLLLVDHGAVLPDEARTHAERIRDAGANMDALIDDLLAYCRLDRVERDPETVALDGVMREVLQQIDAVLTDRDADIQVEGPLPAVLGHRRLLVHVLANLLINATTFVPPDRQPRIVVRAVSANGTVRVSIRDNGIGIAPEHHERIFRIFERLHGRDSFPGTGIGLALVAKSIERMGGRVGVDSVVGEGSTFWFEVSSGGQNT